MWFSWVSVGTVAAIRWFAVGAVPVVRWSSNTGLLSVSCDEERGLQLAFGVEWKAPCWYARQYPKVSDFFVVIDDVGALRGR